MKKNTKKAMAAILGVAMAASVLPTNHIGAVESGKYSYFNNYTLGYDVKAGKVVAYKNGKMTSLNEAGAKTYATKDSNAFAPEVTQAWDTKDLVLTQPVKYTTEDGVVHDVESMLTNFDFIADPTAIDNSDVDGKLYVYGTTEGFSYDNGKLKGNEYANHSITVLSTTDMVNWTDEGFMDNLNLNNDVSNARNKVKTNGRWMDHAWAPSGLKIDADKDGKDEYYLFYTDGGSVVYVRGDSPTGPWYDDIGTSICNTSLANCSDVKWCFDPAVLADDKGNAYVYFGGGVWDTDSELSAHPGTSLASPKTGRVAKLKFDSNGKVSIDGAPKKLDSYYMYEDSEINMFNGKYYYSYCTNFYVPEKDEEKGTEADKWITPGSIAVYVSDDPMNISFNPASGKGDKYTDEDGTYHHYLGTVLDNPSTIYGRFYNNHHHMQNFKGKNYIFYHSTVLDNTLHRVSNDYRCLHVDEITVDIETDAINIEPSYEGASQIENFDPYKDYDGTAKKINATTTSYSAGVKSSRDDEIVVKFPNESPMVLDEIHTGDWTKIQGVDFGKGIKTVSAEIKSDTNEGAIEVWIDDPANGGTKAASIPVSKNDEYTKVTVDNVTDIAGVHDVYFVFRGTGYTVSSWEFTPEGDEVIPTKTPVATREPVETMPPSAPVATAAPYVKGQDYKLVFNPDSVVSDGKDYNINPDYSVSVTGGKQYAGIWFYLPKDAQKAYEKVIVEYKNGGGFGYACRYTDSSADEEIAWGGKLSGTGTEEIKFEKNKPLKGIKFFHDSNTVDIISITFVPADKGETEPTPAPTKVPDDPKATPEPTKVPDDDQKATPEPTKNPGESEATKTPEATPAPTAVPTSTPVPTAAPDAGAPSVKSTPAVDNVKKTSLKVMVKSVIKRKKSITAKVKITNPVKNCKVKWSLDAKGKKLLKLSRKTQKSVKITAGKKKGTATLIVKYGKLAVRKKIKVK